MGREKRNDLLRRWKAVSDSAPEGTRTPNLLIRSPNPRQNSLSRSYSPRTYSFGGPPSRRRTFRFRWSGRCTRQAGEAGTPRGGCSAGTVPSVLVRCRTSEHHRSTVRSGAGHRPAGAAHRLGEALVHGDRAAAPNGNIVERVAVPSSNPVRPDAGVPAPQPHGGRFDHRVPPGFAVLGDIGERERARQTVEPCGGVHGTTNPSLCACTSTSAGMGTCAHQGLCERASRPRPMICSVGLWNGAESADVEA